MNEREHGELEMLKRRQEALQMQLAKLTVDIQQLASRLNAAGQPIAEIQPQEISPAEIPPLRMHEEPASAQTTPAPPPLPPIIATTIVQSLATSSIEKTEPIQQPPIFTVAEQSPAQTEVKM